MTDGLMIDVYVSLCSCLSKLHSVKKMEMSVDLEQIFLPNICICIKHSQTNCGVRGSIVSCVN